VVAIKYLKRFKRWLVGRVINWDEWWARHTPNPEPLGRNEDLSVDKDGMYWRNVLSVTENKPFLNEVYETQQHIENMIRIGLKDGEDFNKIRDLQ
jgi:hypothetical protein